MVYIIVDPRERNSGVPEAILEMGGIIEYKQLTEGDYLISKRIRVERKTSTDFIKSIYDGRLFDQARRMIIVCEKPVLVVEGDLQEVLSMVRSPKIIWGALVSLFINYGFCAFFTTTPEETAQLLIILAEHERRPPIERELVRFKPRISTIRDWQLYILQGLPGIGRKSAYKLLKRFKTVKNVINASPLELSAVIGDKKAKKILTVLNAEFK